MREHRGRSVSARGDKYITFQIEILCFDAAASKHTFLHQLAGVITGRMKGRSLVLCASSSLEIL